MTHDERKLTQEILDGIYSTLRLDIEAHQDRLQRITDPLTVAYTRGIIQGTEISLSEVGLYAKVYGLRQTPLTETPLRLIVDNSRRDKQD